MAVGDWQYKLENFSLYFQGGVRRSVFIFVGISLVLLTPVYFLAQTSSTVWSNLDVNPNHIQNKDIVQPKSISISDFSIDKSQLVPLSNNETILYTTINNIKNQEIGYNPFVYRVQVLDESRSIVFEEVQRGYLLPGEVKYIIANPKNTKGFEMRVALEPGTQPILFNKYANGIKDQIKTEIRNSTVRELPNSNDLEMTAIIKNNSLVEIRALDLLYIIRDRRDRVVGIGEKRIVNLLPGEERQFLSYYPKPKYRRALNLDLRGYVNYLDQGVIIL